MTKQERELLKSIADMMPKLSPSEMQYIAGVIDGMIATKERGGGDGARLAEKIRAAHD